MQQHGVLQVQCKAKWTQHHTNCPLKWKQKQMESVTPFASHTWEIPQTKKEHRSRHTHEICMISRGFSHIFHFPSSWNPRERRQPQAQWGKPSLLDSCSLIAMRMGSNKFVHCISVFSSDPAVPGTLWTLLQPVCPVIRNLKQWNSSPTLHFFSQLRRNRPDSAARDPLRTHRSQQSVERQEKDVARLRKMGNASTRNAYSSSQQKVSSHSHGISKIEGLIVSTTPEPKVKQKRIREPDCHKKGGWVAIGTFVVTHPSEKVPILCNTRYVTSGAFY